MSRPRSVGRCTIVIVNTSDGVVPEAPTAPVVEGRLLGRAAQIARILSRLGLDVRGTITSAERAQRVRAALEELGPTFAKLGQILSTRPDLLSEEIVAELENVKPLTEVEVVRVMSKSHRVQGKSRIRQERSGSHSLSLHKPGRSEVLYFTAFILFTPSSG